MYCREYILSLISPSRAGIQKYVCKWEVRSGGGGGSCGLSSQLQGVWLHEPPVSHNINYHI